MRCCCCRCLRCSCRCCRRYDIQPAFLSETSEHRDRSIVRECAAAAVVLYSLHSCPNRERCLPPLHTETCCCLLSPFFSTPKQNFTHAIFCYDRPLSFILQPLPPHQAYALLLPLLLPLLCTACAPFLTETGDVFVILFMIRADTEIRV